MSNLNIPVAGFDPNGGTIWLDITFPETLHFCRYKMYLREGGSNAVVPGYGDMRGDNANPDDDSFSMPMPVGLNAGRLLIFICSIVDLTKVGKDKKKADDEKSGEDYTIVVKARQGTHVFHSQKIGPTPLVNDEITRTIVFRFEPAGGGTHGAV